MIFSLKSIILKNNPRQAFFHCFLSSLLAPNHTWRSVLKDIELLISQGVKKGTGLSTWRTLPVWNQHPVRHSQLASHQKMVSLQIGDIFHQAGSFRNERNKSFNMLRLSRVFFWQFLLVQHSHGSKGKLWIPGDETVSGTRGDFLEERKVVFAK